MRINWAGGSDGWQVLAEDSYERAVAQFGGHELLDSAIYAVELALTRNPLGFPHFVGYPDLILAKTDLHFLGPEIVPSYRIWAGLDREKRTVHKLWIEYTPPDQGGFPDAEDDIPF